MNKFALADKNSDGILELPEYLSALQECQVDESKIALFREFLHLYSFPY